MNHLRELLEQLQALRVTVPPEIPTQVALHLFEDAARFGERAQCFWLGELDDAMALKPVPELCRLPFQSVWFEGTSTDPSGLVAVSGMLLFEEEARVGFILFGRLEGKWRLLSTGAMESISSQNFATSTATDSIQEIATQDALYAAQGFCSAINCSNVRREEHRAQDKLQKARAKRGKAPLFSYWTLKLHGRQEAGQPAGGTHASPRVHLRRGHPRQFAPGRWTWVQPHAVGNRAAGMVHKDYDGSRLSTVPQINHHTKAPA